MSVVGARLRDVFRVAMLSHGARPGDGGAAMVVEVDRILAEHGVVPSESQRNTLRWLCGWEPATVADVVEMIVAGRSTAEVGARPDTSDPAELQARSEWHEVVS